MTKKIPKVVTRLMYEESERKKNLTRELVPISKKGKGKSFSTKRILEGKDKLPKRLLNTPPPKKKGKETMLSKALKQSSPPKSLVPTKEVQKAKMYSLESDCTIKVLGENIHISRHTPTILRIGHTSKRIEGTPMFMLLDKKVQEFMVVLTKDLLKGRGDARYFRADKKAFDFVTAKYPKVKKSFWLFAFGILLGSVASELNMKRTRKLSEAVLLTIKKQKK